VCVQQSTAQQLYTESEEEIVDSAESDVLEKSTSQERPEDKENVYSKREWLLYGGGAALAVGIAAVAAGSSSGSNSSESSCDEVTVGPSIDGSEWSGTLVLENYGTQAVTATITQCGNRVLIQTSSTFTYGQKLEGTMASDGDMYVWDATTGEEWTTHYGTASSSSIKLYDFVNNFQDMDKLILSRTLATAK
jgi:hypothetical protein